jgi:LysR family positive regulator for ilvC
MDIRELKIFRQLSTSLHFGQTSRTCNMTPSALTRTIQRLELEVGEKLFIRDNRSVAMTSAGEALREYADEVIQRWDELQNKLSADSVLRGDISLYCSVTAAYGILPRILSRFRDAYPEVHINLQTGDAARALPRLQNQEVDLTIAALPEIQPERIMFLKLTETPLVFIASSGFKEKITADGNAIDWQGTPVIMPESGLSRERTNRWFAQKNVTPSIYAQVAGNEAIIAMASLGCGIGVVPELVLDKSPLRSQIKILDVSPQLEPFSIGICAIRKKMSNPKVRAFWEIAKEEAQE